MKHLSSVLTTSIESVAKSAVAIDVVVVGSGPAGVTTAIEVARAGYSVVIFEAGPFVIPAHVGSMPFRSRDDITPRIHELVRYKTAWDSNPNLDADKPRPLNNDAWAAVGGRSLFWGGCTPRFADWDFADWPIDAADMAPFYDRAEEIMHVSGRAPERPPFFRGEKQSALLERLANAGIGASHAALGVDTREALNGYMPRGFDCAIDRLVRSGLLATEVTHGAIVLVPEAPVDRVVAPEGHADGVIVSDPDGGMRYRIRAKHVVLAGGAIQSTRLALASGLDALHPSVGKYVADHLFVQGLFKLKAPMGSPIYAFVDPTPERPFHVQIQGPFPETWYTPYHATVWLDCDPEGLYLLVYCFGVGEPSENNVVMQTRCRSDAPGDLGQYCVVADRTRNDRKVLKAMEAFLPDLAEAMGAECVRSQINPAGSALHEIGGLRMGATAKDGVVDTYGCFHALPNLSVADAAAWPSQGSANSYLTIVAWALRQAGEVVERLKAS
ncbi:GMC oxidoreductase [Acuticoccus sediminis]|uniref:GMC oxidoreductase n=1 Tax=Acuticoccus sediminis TaxID=2184697 RepID=UPI001CFEB208|nr:GMC family oxidoreductase [Acuticoccus sediminis]